MAIAPGTTFSFPIRFSWRTTRGRRLSFALTSLSGNKSTNNQTKLYFNSCVEILFYLWRLQLHFWKLDSASYTLPVRRKKLEAPNKGTWCTLARRLEFSHFIKQEDKVLWHLLEFLIIAISSFEYFFFVRILAKCHIGWPLNGHV